MESEAVRHPTRSRIRIGIRTLPIHNNSDQSCGSSISSESDYGSRILITQKQKQQKKIFTSFLIQNGNLLKLQEKPSALKREHPALKKMKFNNCFQCLRVIFALLDPDPDRGTHRIRIFNTASALCTCASKPCGGRGCGNPSLWGRRPAPPSWGTWPAPASPAACETQTSGTPPWTIIRKI